MSKFKNYIMKTLKTILMIALFSMVTISCTDLTEEDELMQHPPVEFVSGTGDPIPDIPTTDDGTGTGTDTGTGTGTGSDDLGTGDGDDSTDGGTKEG